MANLHLGCFILTEYIGVTYASVEFEIIGRLDNSDVSGYNSLVS